MTTQKKSGPAASSQVFAVSALRAHCRELFGVEREVFDGALYGESAPISKADVKKKIDQFLKREVN